MADLGNRANVNSAIDLLLDDLQPDEAIQPSDHNVLLKDILDTLANGLSTVLRTANTTDGQNLTITSSSIFQFANGSNGRLQSDTLTAFRNWTLPDATGTIALIGDVFTAGSGITENAGQIDLGGTLTIDAIINGAGNRTLKLGTNVLNENLSILEKNSIQAFERYANSFPFLNSGLEITKNPGNFIGNLKSSATDYVQFRLTSDEFLVNSILGTNNLAHQSSSTLSQTIVSDTSGGTSSRLELYGSGRVNLGTNGSVGASIVLDSVNTFTDRNTTAKGLEYALDYSANYTDRSLVDKAFVLANAGDSIYTADGTLTGNRTVDLGDNKLTVNFDVDAATEVAPVNFEFGGYWQGYTRWANSGAVTINVNNNDDALTIFNKVNSTNFKSKAGGGGYLGLEASANNVWRINDGDTQGGIEIGINIQKFYFGTGLMHRIQQGGTGGGVHFYESGIAGSLGYFIVGGNSRVGNEKICLKEPVAIKGGGTSTGSALTIYDNDTTPVKLWDFLDNGDLNGSNNRITNTIVNPSVQETTSTATFTINADQETTGVLTDIALATTIASPTGTPVQGQKLTFRFKDDGTARALTWNAIFRAIGLTLPTTTTANKTIYIGCMYNSTETKWDVIAIKEEV